ncbi:MAG TPA: hypothetical protein VN033_10215 [Vulgatibacter sp.]|nr:hypothetical protein [Vulgatibacter sp.]
MTGAGIAGWVALGVSALLGVCSAAVMIGYLLGREEWLGAGIVACTSAWVVSVVVGAVREGAR